MNKEVPRKRIFVVTSISILALGLSLLAFIGRYGTLGDDNHFNTTSRYFTNLLTQYSTDQISKIQNTLEELGVFPQETFASETLATFEDGSFLIEVYDINDEKYNELRELNPKVSTLPRETQKLFFYNPRSDLYYFLDPDTRSLGTVSNLFELDVESEKKWMFIENDRVLISDPMIINTKQVNFTPRIAKAYTLKKIDNSTIELTYSTPAKPDEKLTGTFEYVSISIFQILNPTEVKP